MFLPDDPTAVAGQYIDGVPGGAHGTSIRADHMNALTNEIANVVTGAGLTLKKTDSGQLLDAIIALGGIAATQVAYRNLTKSTGSDYSALVRGMCEYEEYGILIAVGDQNLVLKSLDGKTWTRVATSTPTFAGDWKCCTFGGGNTFVIAGTNGEIQISTNYGDTWINSPGAGSGYIGTFVAATYSDAATDMFALYGSSGEIQTSATGGGTYIRRKTGGAGFVAAVAGPTYALGLDGDGKIWRADPANPTTWTQVLASTDAPSTLTQMRWYDAIAGVERTRICYKTFTTTFYLSDDLGLTWTPYQDTSGRDMVQIHAVGNKTWLGSDAGVLYVHDFDLRAGDWARISDSLAITGAEPGEPFLYVTRSHSDPNRLLIAPPFAGENSHLWFSLAAPG